MPIIALISLGLVLGGVLYVSHERPDIRRYARIAFLVGVSGATMAAMVAFGSKGTLLLPALFVALAFYRLRR